MVKIERKVLSLKKKIIIATVILFVILIIVLIYMYITQSEVKDWVDEYVFRKNITEDDVTEISIDPDRVNQVYAYNKYIVLLNEKNVTLYNSYGEEITQIDVNINTAIFDSNGKYLVIAEDGGSEICLLLDKTYLWSNTIEGEITQIHVNQNGYVAVVTTDSTHKAILTLYNTSGKQLFKSYFSSTSIIDVSISKDNNYIAVGELDASGTLIQSNIKIISVENAQNDSENAIIYTYSSENSSLITNVNYQNNGQIACMYDDNISIIKDEQNTELLNLTDNENITFMSVEFNNYIAYIEEADTGLFKSSSKIKIINTSNNQETTYELDDIAKDIHVKDNILAVNVGTELYFFDTNGWLIKKYTGNQEITNVVLGDSIAGIIYKDRVIIINL